MRHAPFEDDREHEPNAGKHVRRAFDDDWCRPRAMFSGLMPWAMSEVASVSAKTVHMLLMAGAAPRFRAWLPKSSAGIWKTTAVDSRNLPVPAVQRPVCRASAGQLLGHEDAEAADDLAFQGLGILQLPDSKAVHLGEDEVQVIRALKWAQLGEPDVAVELARNLQQPVMGRARFRSIFACISLCGASDMIPSLAYGGQMTRIAVLQGEVMEIICNDGEVGFLFAFRDASVWIVSRCHDVSWLQKYIVSRGWPLAFAGQQRFSVIV